MLTGAGDHPLRLAQVGGERLFADNVLAVRHKQERLLAVQGVGARQINRIDKIAGGQRLQRGKEMRTGIVCGEGFRLLLRTRIDGVQAQMAGFVRGIDKLARYPVSSHNSKTDHVGSPAANSGRVARPAPGASADSKGNLIMRSAFQSGTSDRFREIKSTCCSEVKSDAFARRQFYIQAELAPHCLNVALKCCYLKLVAALL